ncbi:MAG: hypothetical protein FGM54_04315 [Chitinophagaceae bacterium]|nr:hypothetical protein [Chitinophagaceae bacterium]
MRLLICLFLLFISPISKAQTWDDDLSKTCRIFQTGLNEQAYLAGIEQLDAAVKNYPKEWQAAYYAAWYRVQYLMRKDLKTELYRERYLMQAETKLLPWLNDKGHPEIFILNAYIQVLRMDWYRHQDAQKNTAKAEDRISLARQKTSDNPRLSVVEGLFNYLNPENLDSSLKDRARTHFIEAEALFNLGTTVSYPLMPSWGWDICQEYLQYLR